jgi:hypothetical protein
MSAIKRLLRTTAPTISRWKQRTLEEFLRSNDLWGGAGSIADQPLAGRSAQWKELEGLLIQLGKIQLSHGIANIRTKSGVETFEKWHQLGI